jgi:hypothetical protein
MHELLRRRSFSCRSAGQRALAETTEQHEWATGTAEPNPDILGFTLKVDRRQEDFLFRFLLAIAAGRIGARVIREVPVK